MIRLSCKKRLGLLYLPEDYNRSKALIQEKKIWNNQVLLSVST